MNISFFFQAASLVVVCVRVKLNPPSHEEMPRGNDLHYLLREGRWKAAKDLLKRDRGLALAKGKDENGDLPLHSPVLLKGSFGSNGSCNAISVLVLLIEKYPDGVKTKNKNGRLPVHVAALSSVDHRIIKVLVDRYPKGLKLRDTAGNLPIHLAASSDHSNGNNASVHGPEGHWHTDMLKELIRGYPEGLEHKNLAGRLPIHLAARSVIRWPSMKLLAEKYPQGLNELDDSEPCELLRHPIARRCYFSGIVLNGRLSELSQMLKLSSSAANSRVQELEKENKELADSLASVKEEHAKLEITHEDFLMRVAEGRPERRDLLSCLQLKCVDLANSLDSAKNENNKFKEENKQLADALAHAQEENHKLEHDNYRTQGETELVRCSLSQLEDSLVSTKNENKQLAVSLDFAKEEIVELEGSYEDFLMHAEEENARLLGFASSLQSDSSELADSLASIENENKKLKEENKQLTDSLASAKEANHELEVANHELEVSYEDFLVHVEAENAELRDFASSLQWQSSELADSLSSAEKEKDTLTDLLAHVKKEKNQLDSSLSCVKQENQNLQCEKLALQQNLASVIQAVAEGKHCETRIGQSFLARLGAAKAKAQAFVGLSCPENKKAVSNDEAVGFLKSIAQSLKARLDAVKDKAQATSKPSMAQLLLSSAIKDPDVSKDGLVQIIDTLNTELFQVESQQINVGGILDKETSRDSDTGTRVLDLCSSVNPEPPAKRRRVTLSPE